MTLFRAPGAEWRAFASALQERGATIPFEAEPDFASSHRGWLLGFKNEDGAPLCCVPVTPGWSRTVPGFRILWVSRLGQGIPAEAMDRVARGMVAVARSARAVRMYAQVFDLDAASHDARIDALHRAGFRPLQTAKSYSHTVMIDLRLTEDELLSSFHSTCRKNIRDFSKAGLVCRPVTDPGLARRMNVLLEETMGRTGGLLVRVDWAKWMEFIARKPGRAHLLGVFRPGENGSEELVGYVMARGHGDSVEYTTAASARLPDLRASLLYAPVWHLMRWAKSQGAHWFDLGGVPGPDAPDAERTAGITQFKRYFSSNIVRVASELVFEPIPILARFSEQASALGATAGRLLRRLFHRN